jgi:hypothetical protein
VGPHSKAEVFREVSFFPRIYCFTLSTTRLSSSSINLGAAKKKFTKIGAQPFSFFLFLSVSVVFHVLASFLGHFLSQLFYSSSVSSSS